MSDTYPVSEGDLKLLRDGSKTIEEMCDVAETLLGSDTEANNVLGNLGAVIKVIAERSAEIRTVASNAQFAAMYPDRLPVWATVMTAEWSDWRWLLTLRAEDNRELRTELRVVPDDPEAVGTLFRRLTALGVPTGYNPATPYAVPFWKAGRDEREVARRMTGRRVQVTVVDDDGTCAIEGKDIPDWPQPWQVLTQQPPGWGSGD